LPNAYNIKFTRNIIIKEDSFRSKYSVDFTQIEETLFQWPEFEKYILLRLATWI